MGEEEGRRKGELQAVANTLDELISAARR